MAEDLADRLDDLICSFDKVIPGNFEGTLIFILAFWALAGGIVYLISVFVSKSVKDEEEKKKVLGAKDKHVGLSQDKQKDAQEESKEILQNTDSSTKSSSIEAAAIKSLSKDITSKESNLPRESLEKAAVVSKEASTKEDSLKDVHSKELSFKEAPSKEVHLKETTLKDESSKGDLVRAKELSKESFPEESKDVSRKNNYSFKVSEKRQEIEVEEDLIVPSVAYVCGSAKKTRLGNGGGLIPYSPGPKGDPFMTEVEEEIIIPAFAYKCGGGGHEGLDSSPPPLEREEETTKVDFPKCSGSDSKAVEWVNACFERLFEPFTMEYMKQIWIEDLNDYIKSLDDKTCIMVTDIIKAPSTSSPKDPVPPTFTSVVSQTHQRDNITVTADLNTELFLKLSVRSPEKEDEDTYTFDVTKLRGRLSISILNCDRLVIFKLDGWPEIKTEAIGVTSDDEKSFVTEVVVSALRGTTITLDMDDFLEGTIFPVFTREKNIQTDPSNSLFSSGDDFFVKSPFTETTKEGTKKSHTLSVLVVKASGLLSANHPFVILELDEPSQKFKTGLSPSLMWNEDFTLQLNPHSKEILFEVWDIENGDEVFLGLGIVAIDELLIAPSQRHVIPLQGRPHDALRQEESGGLLTIQFILSDLNKDIALNRSFEQAAAIGKTFKSPIIDEPKTILKNAIKGNHFEDSEDSDMSFGLRDESPSSNRSRNRKKKRRLVSTLKKRITGRRSFSLGGSEEHRDSSKNDALDPSRSISADRAYSLSKLNTLEGNSNLPFTNAISTSTFISEESSLVMEVDENNIKKYYFIPSEVAAKEKPALKGTRLHIYMDHIFVAKHIKRGKACHVCSKNIPFRLKKQGYMCRDCQLICHKPCHIQVGTHCLESSLPAMDILHIKKDL